VKQLSPAGLGFTVSRLSFGTASLHHLPTAKRRQHLLGAALEHGFTHFDTSPYYGFGVAERELGRMVRGHSRVTIGSKFGLYPPGQGQLGAVGTLFRKVAGRLVPSLSAPRVDWTIAAAQRSLEQTLRVLHRDCLDVIMLHEPQIGKLDPDALYDRLSVWRQQGKIRSWGCAGPVRSMGDLASHPISTVLQVPAADLKRCRELHREPHFLYSALSARMSEEGSVSGTLTQVLSQADGASLIVSTRRAERVRDLSRMIAVA
jgi:aryl-alcohol dehydrogenase-like predicted oxidoreductase